MCPPVIETHSMSRSRISWASCGSWSRRSRLRSAGHVDRGRGESWSSASGFVAGHPERAKDRPTHASDARASLPSPGAILRSAQDDAGTELLGVPAHNIPRQCPQCPRRHARLARGARPPAGPALRPPAGRRPPPAARRTSTWPARASRPAVLPSSSLVPVQSSTSSAIWKASPMSSPNAVSAATCAGAPSAAIPPSVQEARMSAPVLPRWTAISCGRVSVRRSASRSSHCPPTMPSMPPGLEQLRRPFGRGPPAAAPARPAASASTRAATGTSRKPTRVAVGTSNRRWVVGRPRRRSSSSMQGRSSCTSE